MYSTRVLSLVHVSQHSMSISMAHETLARFLTHTTRILTIKNNCIQLQPILYCDCDFFKVYFATSAADSHFSLVQSTHQLWQTLKKTNKIKLRQSWYLNLTLTIISILSRKHLSYLPVLKINLPRTKIISDGKFAMQIFSYLHLKHTSCIFS